MGLVAPSGLSPGGDRGGLGAFAQVRGFVRFFRFFR